MKLQKNGIADSEKSSKPFLDKKTNQKGVKKRARPIRSGSIDVTNYRCGTNLTKSPVASVMA
jgi:hypothetical protein